MSVRKALSRLLALSVAALYLLVCPLFAQAPENRAGAIAAALQNRDFNTALRLLGPALQEFPSDPQLWAMQGAAYAGAHKDKQALVSYKEALRFSPDYLPALQGAAQIEYDNGSPAAIPLIQRVLRLRPGDRTGHAMLAVLEYRRGNCASATDHFEKAGSVLDRQLPALHAQGTCLVRMKQMDRAAAVFQRALALQPNNEDERRLLASVQLMAHKPEDALTTLRPLLNTAGSSTLALVSAAYEEAGDTEQAVSSLQKAILSDPSNVNLYLDFAHVCYAHNSAQVGVNVVSDGIGLQPNAAPLYLARGALYVQLGKYDNAEADFDKAHELDPRQSLSSAALAVTAMQKNDLDRALATVQSKLKRKPDDPLLLYLQADLLLQKGAAPDTPEFKLAKQSARKAVDLNPGLAEARSVLAKLYLQSGEYSRAVAESRKALELDPKDQSSVYHLIQALRKTGKKSEIPELLKRLAQLREQAAKEEGLRNRYKLVEGDTGAGNTH